MLDFLKMYWPTIMSVGSFFVSLVIGLLALKFAKREDVDVMRRDISTLKTDVEKLQTHVASLPTAKDIHELQLSISGLRGDIQEIKPQIHAVKNINDLLLEYELNKRKRKQ